MKAGWGLVSLVALSACLGGVRDVDEVLDLVPPVVELPPGCDATRPSVAYRGGEAVAADVPPPLPCVSYIGTASFEPNVGVTSEGTVFMYPASALGLPAPVSIARSRDEGATWQILTPNVAGQPTHPYSQDPHMYVDPTTDRLFAEDLLLVPPPCGMMSISDNEGDTWAHTQSGCMVMDHVTLFSGPPVTSTTLGYPNVVYRCAISGGALAGFSTMVQCQRSIDGGRTWLPPGAPPFVFPPGAAAAAGGCAGGNGHGTTNSEGRVFLPRGHCGQPWLAISDDEAVTWRTVQVSDHGMRCVGAGAGNCEHDAGVGEDPAGTLYYAWVTRDRLPVLSRSIDGGATWSEPVDAGFPGLVEATHLQMAVGGEGKVAIVYYGTTTSPGAPWTGNYNDTYWNAFLVASFDADTETPTFHVATLNDPADPLIRGECGSVRCQELFDYIDVRIGPDGTPWVALVDGCFDECELANQESRALVGRAWGGPSLWDAADPNGHFPDEAPP